jgi:hypothetical protein
MNYSQCDNNNNSTSSLSLQKQKKIPQLSINVNHSSVKHNNGYGTLSRCHFYSGGSQKGLSESSSNSSSLSDLDEITTVKEEPLSPHSSCPPSPNSNYNNPLPSISSINSDLMYDRKVS